MSESSTKASGTWITYGCSLGLHTVAASATERASTKKRGVSYSQRVNAWCTKSVVDSLSCVNPLRIRNGLVADKNGLRSPHQCMCLLTRLICTVVFRGLHRAGETERVSCSFVYTTSSPEPRLRYEPFTRGLLHSTHPRSALLRSALARSALALYSQCSV